MIMWYWLIGTGTLFPLVWSFFTSSGPTPRGRNGSTQKNDDDNIAAISSMNFQEQQALEVLDRFITASLQNVVDVNDSLKDVYDWLMNGRLVLSRFSSNSNKAFWDKMLTVLQQYRQQHQQQRQKQLQEQCMHRVLEIARFLLQSLSSSSSSITSEVASSDTFASIVDCLDGEWLEIWASLACQPTPPSWWLSFDASGFEYTRVSASLQCLQLIMEKTRPDRIVISVGPAILRRLGDLPLQQHLPSPILAQALLLVSTIAKRSAAASAIWIKQGLHMNLLREYLFLLGERPSDGDTTKIPDYVCALTNILRHGTMVSQLAWRTASPRYTDTGSFGSFLTMMLGWYERYQRRHAEYSNPPLTEAAEVYIRVILDLIAAILEQQQQAVTPLNNNNNNSWLAQFWERERDLVSFVWELATGGRLSVTLSTSLQLHALYVASKFMPYVTECTPPGAMDRLLDLICYGMGGSSTLHSTTPSVDDRLRMSLAGVHLFRQTLFKSTTQEYGNEQARLQAFEQAGPRLLCIVQQYLRYVTDETFTTNDVQVTLMGSLLALGALVQASRLQQQSASYQPPPTLMNGLLGALKSLSRLHIYDEDATNQICMGILRFLGEWMQGDLAVTRAFLLNDIWWAVSPAVLHPVSAPAPISSSISRENVATLVLSRALWDIKKDRTRRWWTCDKLCDVLMLYDKNNTKDGVKTTTTRTNAAGMATLVCRLDALVHYDDDNNNKNGHHGDCEDGGGLLPWCRDDMEAAIWLNWCNGAVLPMWQWGVRELALFASSSFASNEQTNGSRE